MAMTADTAFAPRIRGPRLYTSLFSLFSSVAAAQRAARVYAELDALSDGALAARGLERSDIAAIAARELDRA